jgi:hypothetical protein
MEKTAKKSRSKNWSAADTPIICDSCEGFYPTSARSQGYWFVPGNSEHRIAVWICGWCARSVERWRAMEDIRDAKEKAARSKSHTSRAVSQKPIVISHVGPWRQAGGGAAKSLGSPCACRNSN